jgi:hypothetical protein
MKRSTCRGYCGETCRGVPYPRTLAWGDPEAEERDYVEPDDGPEERDGDED